MSCWTPPQLHQVDGALEGGADLGHLVFDPRHPADALDIEEALLDLRHLLADDLHTQIEDVLPQIHAKRRHHARQPLVAIAPILFHGLLGEARDERGG